jgi:hypothetical protein
VTVYPRNIHAKQLVYLPIRPGWCRVLKPAVTTAVPEALLHTAAVRQLLLRKLVDVVDGAAWDPDVRQRRASRADTARAIAAAEQREFDRLLADMPCRPHYWSAQRIEHLRARIVAGVTMTELAGQFGLSRQAIGQVVQRHGLKHVRPGTVRRAGCLRRLLQPLPIRLRRKASRPYKRCADNF